MFRFSPERLRRGGAAIEIQFADRKSSSQDELTLGQMLDSDGTLVGLKKNAPEGVYKIRLEGKGLALRTEAVEKRLEKESLASMFAAPKQQVKFDARGQAKLILTGSWLKDDVIALGATIDGAVTVSVRFPGGANVPNP